MGPRRFETAVRGVSSKTSLAPDWLRNPPHVQVPDTTVAAGTVKPTPSWDCDKHHAPRRPPPQQKGGMDDEMTAAGEGKGKGNKTAEIKGTKPPSRAGPPGSGPFLGHNALTTMKTP